MSVLSEERLIDADILSQFIPEDPESTQLATLATSGSHSYESDRELLYKILYELRGNVSDLRRDMNSLRKQLDEARALGGAASFGGITAIDTDAHPLAPVTKSVTVPPAGNTIVEAEVEEIREPESLNLSNMGRQMLEKALERNGGNRKKSSSGIRHQ